MDFKNSSELQLFWAIFLAFVRILLMPGNGRQDVSMNCGDEDISWGISKTEYFTRWSKILNYHPRNLIEGTRRVVGDADVNLRVAALR